jgi:hypothetical protein
MGNSGCVASTAFETFLLAGAFFVAGFASLSAAAFATLVTFGVFAAFSAVAVGFAARFLAGFFGSSASIGSVGSVIGKLGGLVEVGSSHGTSRRGGARMFLNGSGELVSACGNGKKLASLRVEETLELPVVKPLGVIRHGSG